MPLSRQLHDRIHLGSGVENEIGLTKKFSSEVDDIGGVGLENCLGYEGEGRDEGLDRSYRKVEKRNN